MRIAISDCYPLHNCMRSGLDVREVRIPTAPSGPTVTPPIPSSAWGVGNSNNGTARVYLFNWRFAEARVIASNVPSGPAAMPVGSVVKEFVKSVTAPEVEIRPIELPPLSNQSAPSDPATIPFGEAITPMFALPMPKLVTSPMLIADADWAAANGAIMVPHTRRGTNARMIIDGRQRRSLEFANFGFHNPPPIRSRSATIAITPATRKNQQCNIFGHGSAVAP